jgi:hypothetical protein
MPIIKSTNPKSSSGDVWTTQEGTCTQMSGTCKQRILQWHAYP